MPEVSLWFEGGEDSLSVRRFTTREALSEPFAVTVWARSPSPDVDLERILGKPAALHVSDGWFSALPSGGRRWAGLCHQIELVQAEPTGLSTYQLRIVPSLWLLGQRRNLRTFQHLGVPDIVSRVLDDWGIQADFRVDKSAHPRLEYKVQYDETDLAFVTRLLAEAGITYLFEDAEEGDSKLVFTDKPQGAEVRGAGKSRGSGGGSSTPAIRYVDNPNQAPDTEMVTAVRVSGEVRPGAATLRDFDFRNPGVIPEASAEPA